MTRSPPESARDIGWAALLLAVLLALSALAAQEWLVRDFKRLPPALFGGDFTYQSGCIQSIKASGNPMASCSTCGALPGYLPLYGTLVADFSKVTGIPVERSMLLLSGVIRGLSSLLVFVLFAGLFGRCAGLLLAALWTVVHPGVALRYTEFTAAIIVPLYFQALFRFVEAPRPGRGLYLGLVLAAAGYSHAVAFIGGSVIAVVATLLGARWRAPWGGIGRELATAARGLMVVAACAALALGYWYRPIFVYHGRTSAHYTEWNGGVALATLAQQIAYARGVLATFVRLDEWPQALVNLLFFCGLAMVWRVRDRRRFVPGVLIAAVTFLWMFHFFVTMPLLHSHFVPDYVRWLLWDCAVFLVAAVPVTWLCDRIRDRGAAIGLGTAIVVAAVAGLAAETSAIRQAPDMVKSREPIPRKYSELQAYVLAHTNPDDVVLSSNELSFGWSALTGRKTVVTRRAQNDAFVDMDERNHDAALILYGRDDALRRRLLAKWGVDYVLWGDEWYELEYWMSRDGELNYDDPLLYFFNPAYDEDLTRAGVAILHVRSWVDPLMRGPEYQTFDLTLVSPENYQRPDRPWQAGLDSLLEEVWSTREDGRKVVVLYRVRL